MRPSGRIFYSATPIRFTDSRLLAAVFPACRLSPCNSHLTQSTASALRC